MPITVVSSLEVGTFSNIDEFIIGVLNQRNSCSTASNKHLIMVGIFYLALVFLFSSSGATWIRAYDDTGVYDGSDINLISPIAVGL